MKVDNSFEQYEISTIDLFGGLILHAVSTGRDAMVASIKDNPWSIRLEAARTSARTARVARCDGDVIVVPDLDQIFTTRGATTGGVIRPLNPC